MAATLFHARAYEGWNAYAQYLAHQWFGGVNSRKESVSALTRLFLRR
jgi:hypothetical protein